KRIQNSEFRIQKLARIALPLFFAVCLMPFCRAEEKKVTKFDRDYAPSEGLVKPQERPYRDELCLNGSWQFQPVPVPAGYQPGNGTPPDLAPPSADKWDATPLKVPSPWNINTLYMDPNRDGGDFVAFPSYPESWNGAQMGWLRRSVSVPKEWEGKRVFV